jgi:hypothetical protein
MTVKQPVRNACVVLAMTSLLAACGTRQPAAPEPPPPAASAHNTVVMPPVAYGITDKGLQLSKADDNCGVPDSLRQAVEDQLEEPYEFVLPARGPSTESAPLLKIEITDILANGGGMYGGPKIVQIHGVLDRPGMPPAQFTAQREMFIYFGFPKSTCSMVGNVTYALGGDILKWLRQPMDGARLGDL